MHVGVAQHCARARTAPDDVRIRQAMASQTHGAGLFTCPSSGPSARVAPAAAWTGHGSCFGRWFRHGPWRETTRHVRHRPAPVSRLPAFRRQEVGPRPGGWLCTPPERAARQRNRVGHRLPPGPGTRYAGPRRAFLPPGPTRSRSIRRRKRRHDGTGGGGCGKDCRVFWLYNWNRLGVGQVLCTRRCWLLRNPISPLAGEMSAKQTEGGMVPLVSSVRILARFTPSVTYGDISPAKGGDCFILTTHPNKKPAGSLRRVSCWVSVDPGRISRRCFAS